MFEIPHDQAVWRMKMKENKALPETLTRHGSGQGPVIVQGQNSDAFRGRVSDLIVAFGSVAEVSRKCGIPESTIKKWADGISDPSRERCISLARGTGVSLMWLIAGAPPMWAADQSPNERDTQLIALGDPDDPAVQAAQKRRTQAIKDWSQGINETASDSHSQPVKQDDLMMAVQLAEEALDGGKLEPKDYAQLVTLIYDALVNGLPSAQVIAFARPAARGLKYGDGDGQSAVGNTGQGLARQGKAPR